MHCINFLAYNAVLLPNVTFDSLVQYSYGRAHSLLLKKLHKNISKFFNEVHVIFLTRSATCNASFDSSCLEFLFEIQYMLISCQLMSECQLKEKSYLSKIKKIYEDVTITNRVFSITTCTRFYLLGRELEQPTDGNLCRSAPKWVASGPHKDKERDQNGWLSVGCRTKREEQRKHYFALKYESTEWWCLILTSSNSKWKENLQLVICNVLSTIAAITSSQSLKNHLLKLLLLAFVIHEPSHPAVNSGALWNPQEDEEAEEEKARAFGKGNWTQSSVFPTNYFLDWFFFCFVWSAAKKLPGISSRATQKTFQTKRQQKKDK